jgi:hypothetical protein
MRFDVRTISAALELALTSSSRSDHLKVEVDSTGSGDFIELTSYWQKDWVISCTINEDEDQPVATASLEIKRSFEQIHMSPLVASSPVNASSTLLYVNREIKIYCATTGADVTPQSSDWALRFRGYIDSIDMAGANIKISCRDLGAKVIDAFIESIVLRGTSGGQAVETAMQAIITASVPSPPTLYTPTSPNWNILEYYQKKEPVMNAIRRLADQIGWIVRYRWDSGTSAFRLTFYGPNRSVSSTVRDFSADQYWSIGKASIGLQGVRTKVAVYFYDNPGEEIDVRTAVSGSPILSKYGTRYMEVTHAASSNIDDGTEAQAMADRILGDLEEPTLSHSITMPLFWPAELGDYYGFEGNEVIYDSKQSLALFGVTHRFADGNAETVMRLRGKPASASRRWLSLEGRGGVAPPVINKTDAAATGIATAPAANGGIVITYTNPAEMTPPIRNWATTRLYVSTTSGFTPGPSNLVAQNKSTRFVVEDLVSGTTYYAKIQIIDTSNNVSTTSSQQTIVAGTVGALHIDKYNEYGNIMPNPTLTNWSSPHAQTTDAPDNWAPTAWNTAITDSAIDDAEWKSSGTERVYFDTSVVQSSANSVVCMLPATPVHNGLALKTRDMIPCSADTLYRATWIARFEQASSSKIVRALIYDSSKSLLQIVNSPGPSNFATGTFLTWSAVFRTGANARWIRLEAGQVGGISAYKMYVDRMSLSRAQTSFRSQASGGTYTNAWNRVAFATTIHDYGGEYSDPTFTVIDDGLYTFEAVVGLTALGSGQSMQVALYINGSAYSRSVIAENNSGGTRDTYAIVSTKPILLSVGDTAEVYVWHDDAGGSPLTALTGNHTQFAGSRLND